MIRGAERHNIVTGIARIVILQQWNKLLKARETDTHDEHFSKTNLLILQQFQLFSTYYTCLLYTSRCV